MVKIKKIENRRYIGNKTKLRDWIISTIQAECETGGSFADIFAGTGTVSVAAAPHFEKIILNDILHSNFVCHKAFFSNNNYNLVKLTKIIEKYNSLDHKRIKANYFSKNFGGKYFSKDVAKLIGFIRDDIESKKNSLSEKEYYILLTSLIYSVDKVANTVGHYDAYIRKTPKSTDFSMFLIEPFYMGDVDIYQEDANELVLRIKADVVYIDPPYNSRQYSRFYHLLETLIKWDSPELFGTALKPETENSSDYCKSKAPDVFDNLVKRLDCKYIVVSYNNTYASKSNSSRNKISHDQIIKTLESKGKTKTFKKSHKHFNAGNTDFADHQEWLFVTKVHE
ncbi:adenine methyltransferase [bacterium]|nr:adenine methyltransferase [bacterium]|tara:strand:- start:6743 stop:7756 length:1014 start_codon:yes stop_codon:yes gene_type:complete